MLESLGPISLPDLDELCLLNEHSVGISSVQGETRFRILHSLPIRLKGIREKSIQAFFTTTHPKDISMPGLTDELIELVDQFPDADSIVAGIAHPRAMHVRAFESLNMRVQQLRLLAIQNGFLLNTNLPFYGRACSILRPYIQTERRAYLRNIPLVTARGLTPEDARYMFEDVEKAAVISYFQSRPNP